MKLLKLLLGIALLAGSQFAFVLTAAIEQFSDSVLMSKAFPGYKLAPATWIGEIEGQPYNISGDAYSVSAELRAKHPNVDLSAGNSGANRTIDDDVASGANRTMDDGSAMGRLSKRARIWPPLCVPVPGQPWKPATVDLFYQCSRQLSEQGTSLFYVQPRTCSQVCARPWARVMACNDAYHVAQIESNFLADSISKTCGECSKHWNGLENHECGGQLFHDDDWNVVLYASGTKNV